MRDTREKLAHNFAPAAAGDEDNLNDAQNQTRENTTLAAREMRDKKFQADLELVMQQIGTVSCSGTDKRHGTDETVSRLLQSMFNGNKPYMSTRLHREAQQVSTRRDSRTELRIRSGKAFSCNKTREQRDAEEARRARAERRARHENRLRREAREALRLKMIENQQMTKVRNPDPARGVLLRAGLQPAA